MPPKDYRYVIVLDNNIMLTGHATSIQAAVCDALSYSHNECPLVLIEPSAEIHVAHKDSPIWSDIERLNDADVIYDLP